MKMHWIYTLLLAPFCIAGVANESSLSRVRRGKQEAYRGMVDVSLTHEEGIIRARIETADLLMASLSWEQLDDYAQLFGNPTTVEKYSDGIPWTLDEVKEFMGMWMNRWDKYEDPFSAFAIFEKSSGTFIGHFVLGHGAIPGQAEMAFLFKPEYRNKNYASQAVMAVLYSYVPLLIEKQYPINHFDQEVYETRLETVHATSRVDNGSSCSPLKLSGMNVGGIEVVWGHPRFHFFLTVEELLKLKTVN